MFGDNQAMANPSAGKKADASSAQQPQTWPDEWACALSDSALSQASSAAIFGRGKAYARSGAVELVDEDPMPEPALRALVTGSQNYTTEVWIEGDEVAGSCDCPHADDGWFCKHQVAVALVWRDRLGGHAETVEAPARSPAPGGARRARTASEKRQDLHDFLHGQQAATLADRLLGLADQDHHIARELQQWRKAGALGKNPAEHVALINDMLAPGRDFIAWGESASYLRHAEAVLPLLQQARSHDPASAAVLCLHALRRSWDALQQADDSDGEIGGLCEAIGAEWLLSLRAAGPQRADFGDGYLQLQLDDPIDSFDSAAVEATIGEPALARYRVALAERWRQAKSAVQALQAEHAAKVAKGRGRAPAHDKVGLHDLKLWTLERLHLAQLQATGQVDEALAVLREDLSEGNAHHRVIDFLEGHGRFDEAFAQTRHGNKAFPDDWRLQEDLLRCYEREGMSAEALVLRRQQFERGPGVERFQLVLKAGLADGQDMVALRRSLLDELEDRELKAMSRPRNSLHDDFASEQHAERNVSLRAELLCAESRWSEACTLVQPPAVCREDILNRIALQLPSGQAEHAIALLLRVFNSAMRGASSPYRGELALVEQISRRMDPARRSTWLAQLRQEFKAKRNFVRDLPRALS